MHIPRGPHVSAIPSPCTEKRPYNIYCVQGLKEVVQCVHCVYTTIRNVYGGKVIFFYIDVTIKYVVKKENLNLLFLNLYFIKKKNNMFAYKPLLQY